MTDSKAKNRIAIVTGASRNIGRAIALDLARLGFDLVVHSGSDAENLGVTVQLVEELGRKAVGVTGDLTDPTTADKLASVARDMGEIAVLVNNAALRRAVPFEEMDLDEWRAVTAINLDAAFIASRAVIGDMLAAGWGRIINIGGMTGHTGAKHRAHVVTTKAALVGLTKALASEYAGRGITAHCVVPGEIETARGASAGAPGQHGKGPPPVGRKGEPEEVSAMVAHLCGPHSDYLTGQTYHVNGGVFMP